MFCVLVSTDVGHFSTLFLVVGGELRSLAHPLMRRSFVVAVMNGTSLQTKRSFPPLVIDGTPRDEDTGTLFGSLVLYPYSSTSCGEERGRNVDVDKPDSLADELQREMQASLMFVCSAVCACGHEYFPPAP